MSNIVRFNFSYCISGEKGTVTLDDTTSAITQGDVLLIEIDGKQICALVESNPISGSGSTDATFVNFFNSCAECLKPISDYVTIKSCLSGSIFAVSVNDLPIPPPNIGEIVYVGLNVDKDIIDCYELTSYGNFNEVITPESLSIVNSFSSEYYTECINCTLSNVLIYKIIQCFTEATWYCST